MASSLTPKGLNSILVPGTPYVRDTGLVVVAVDKGADTDITATVQSRVDENGTVHIDQVSWRKAMQGKYGGLTMIDEASDVPPLAFIERCSDMSLTAANAVITLVVPGVFGAGRTLHGFSADDVFESETASNVTDTGIMEVTLPVTSDAGMDVTPEVWNGHEPASAIAGDPAKWTGHGYRIKSDNPNWDEVWAMADLGGITTLDDAMKVSKSFTFMDPSNEPIVRLTFDGQPTVWVSPDYAWDAAAKQFWNAVARCVGRPAPFPDV